MKRFEGMSAIGIAAIIALPLLHFSTQAKAGDHAYVGVQKCKMCHNSKAKGAQYTQWNKTTHAQAYKTLASEEAKKVAAEKGIADPQKASECLKCHVTGHDAPADKLIQKYSIEDGVGCESCHGPGSDYQKKKVMKVRDQAVTAGLIIPNEKTCIGCHNSESPFFEGFDYATYFEKIAHPNPNKAK
ncbi:MAG: cytochrome c family protein [Acidobacteriota bacterium]